MSLTVFAFGTPSGRLYRSDLEDGSFFFGYHDALAKAYAVSLTMPVLQHPYDSMNTVHPIFEMNLPEGSLRQRLQLLFAKAIPNFDDLDLLRIVGTTQIGRLRYASAGAVPSEPAEEDLHKLITYRGTHDLFEDLLTRYATSSGISGMQPKVLIRAKGAGRVTHRGATHIVKSFEPAEHPELAFNEYFAMSAVRAAGVPTANVTLSSNRRMLLVDRFDLQEDGSYTGVEDFCVLSGMRAHGRYDGAYEDVAQTIRDFVSPKLQRKAMEQLFAMVVLACALENGDMHLKNFSVQYTDPESEVWLSPAYDFVTTTLYQRGDSLALSLADSKAFAARKVLEQFGRTACGLSKVACTRIFDACDAAVRKTMAQLRRTVKGSTDRGLGRQGERLEEAYTRGLARIAPR
jgi:serine/threonine-protein kinase HipA